MKQDTVANGALPDLKGGGLAGLLAVLATNAITDKNNHPRCPSPRGTEPLLETCFGVLFE